jgi:hypothetical protein
LQGLLKDGSVCSELRPLDRRLENQRIDEGKSLEIGRVDAQGEMINMPAILQNYDNSRV